MVVISRLLLMSLLEQACSSNYRSSILLRRQHPWRSAPGSVGGAGRRRPRREAPEDRDEGLDLVPVQLVEELRLDRGEVAGLGAPDEPEAGGSEARLDGAPVRFDRLAPNEPARLQCV